MLHQFDGQKIYQFCVIMDSPDQPATTGAMYGCGASGAHCNRVTGIHAKRYVANGNYEHNGMLVDTATNSLSSQPLGKNTAERLAYQLIPLLATGHEYEGRPTTTVL